jgi:hypothetical protein
MSFLQLTFDIMSFLQLENSTLCRFYNLLLTLCHFYNLLFDICRSYNLLLTLCRSATLHSATHHSTSKRITKKWLKCGGMSFTISVTRWGEISQLNIFLWTINTSIRHDDFPFLLSNELSGLNLAFLEPIFASCGQVDPMSL